MSEIKYVKYALRAEPLPDTPQIRAMRRLLAFGMQSSIFGSAPNWEWARAQLTEAERAALAKEAERPEWPMLAEPPE